MSKEVRGDGEMEHVLKIPGDVMEALRIPPDEVEAEKCVDVRRVI